MELMRFGSNISELSPNLKSRTSLSTEDGLYDSLDGSSTELTDVFEEQCFEIEPWSPPDADLCQKIVDQLEYYFSNDNLAEDAFLLKHVQKNRMGYVSLKLLTSFKKIWELTGDWRTTRIGARSSRLLEVNEEGTKVRRWDPIPKWLLCVPTSKLLLAWDLLEEQSTEKAVLGSAQQSLMERAMQIFGSYGTITSLRILRPGKELPAELRRYAKKHSELGCKACAVVEYEYLEGARKAYEALQPDRQKPAGKGVHVVLLGSRGTCKPCCSRDWTTEESEDPEGGREPGSSKRPNRKAKRLLEDSALYSSSESDFAPASPRPVRRVTRSQALYGSPLAIPRASSFQADPYSNPLASSLGSPLLPRKLFSGGHTPSPLVNLELGVSPVLCGSGSPGWSKSSGDFSQDTVGSPWVQRRRTAAQISSKEKGQLLLAGQIKKPRAGVAVMRQPLGPDGTKGFYNCIGRGKIFLQQ